MGGRKQLFPGVRPKIALETSSVVYEIKLETEFMISVCTYTYSYMITHIWVCINMQMFECMY